MQRTIFILGTDPEHCAELRIALQAAAVDRTVTTLVGNSIPRLRESDTIVLSSEDPNAGVMYRQLLKRLDDQANKAQVLGDLIRRSMSSRSLEESLEQIVAKSAEILGDTAFIVLDSEAKYQLEAAFTSDSDRLKKMLLLRSTFRRRLWLRNCFAIPWKRESPWSCPICSTWNLPPNFTRLLKSTDSSQ